MKIKSESFNKDFTFVYVINDVMNKGFIEIKIIDLDWNFPKIPYKEITKRVGSNYRLLFEILLEKIKESTIEAYKKNEEFRTEYEKKLINNFYKYLIL